MTCMNPSCMQQPAACALIRSADEISLRRSSEPRDAVTPTLQVPDRLFLAGNGFISKKRPGPTNTSQQVENSLP